MKICLLSRYFDFRNAGIGRCSQKLLFGLTGKGHTVRCVSTDGTSLQSYFKYIFYDIKKSMPPDCDIYHSMTPMEGVWIPKDRGVVTFHDLIPMVYPNLAGAGLNNNYLTKNIGKGVFRFASKVSSKAKVVVCNSENTRLDVIQHLGVDGNKIKVIRWGINEDLEPKVKKDDVFTIGYLGQLDRRKRVELLI